MIIFSVKTRKIKQTMRELFHEKMQNKSTESRRDEKSISQMSYICRFFSVECNNLNENSFFLSCFIQNYVFGIPNIMSRLHVTRLKSKWHGSLKHKLYS